MDSDRSFQKSMPEVFRAVMPMTLALGTGVLLITYVPVLTTASPQWLDRQGLSVFRNSLLIRKRIQQKIRHCPVHVRQLSGFSKLCDF